jgi:hypothetical protein
MLISGESSEHEGFARPPSRAAAVVKGLRFLVDDECFVLAGIRELESKSQFSIFLRLKLSTCAKFSPKHTNSLCDKGTDLRKTCC